MTRFGVCWVSSSGETSLVLGTSAHLVLGDVTGGTEILRPLELLPQHLEILSGQPKETIEHFPFPHISMFYRLQMAQRAWEAGEGDGLLGTLGAVQSEDVPSVGSAAMLKEQGHSFNFGIS